MADQNTPLDHSSVGGSTAARRIGCPRSLVLEPRVPKDPGSIYAREGTALHELMAKVLIEEKEPYDLLPFTHNQPEKGGEPAWSFEVTADLWDELGEPALAAFDRFCDALELETGEPVILEIETRCAFPGIDGAFGTTDILGRSGHVAFVWDWKFGSNPVQARDNKQLLFYAKAASVDYSELFAGVDEVWLCIMQPKIDSDGPDVWRTDLDALDAFAVELSEAVRIADEQGDKAPCVKGDWCKFAPCRAICPHFAGVGIELGARLEALGHRDNKGKPRISGHDIADDLPALLEMAEAANDWVKALHAAALGYAQGGGRIEGYKLVEKRSSGREWTRDDEKIKQWFSRNGVKVDDYAPRVLITPPAAEKLLKIEGKELPEKLYKAKPSSGTSLVKEDSPREAVGSAADTARELGARLAAYAGEGA